MILLSTQTLVIITSVVVFLAVVILLVAILLYAKKKLMPSGTVKIYINEGYLELETEPGNSLLLRWETIKSFYLQPVAEVAPAECAAVKWNRAVVLYSHPKPGSSPEKNKMKTGALPAR
jgi:Na+-transporting NADH:ubiquinone oxidoreductase subunit NqrF